MQREKFKRRTRENESTDARRRGGATRSSDEAHENGRSEGVALSSLAWRSTRKGEEPVSEAKPFSISKRVVWEAYERVKANKGAAGVDSETIEEFEKNLKDNLYKLWNRMSSGAYFPPPVRTVEIPKDNGGKRRLGI